MGVPGTLPYRGSGSSSLRLCQKSGGAGHHELWFDGEQLWYRRNPAWSGELPYQTDDGEQFSPLTPNETDTAVELLRENGLVLERFPRYGYERCIPTQEEVLALAEELYAALNADKTIEPSVERLIRRQMEGIIQALTLTESDKTLDAN